MANRIVLWRRGCTVAMATFILACGSSDTRGDPDAGGAGGATPSIAKGGGCCAVNTTNYACPDAVSLMRCSDSNPDPSDCTLSPTCTSNNTTATSFCCGLNDTYFDCASETAFQACTMSDPSQCTSRVTVCP